MPRGRIVKLVFNGIRQLLLVALLVFAASAQFAQTENLLPFKVPVDTAKLPESALIETNKGPFEIKFYRTQAPVSVRNFEYLAKTGFYDGVLFHRYVPGFVIQGGAPKGQQKGGPGWSLPPEINSRLLHAKGSVGWARVPSASNPERLSDGSQFYITLEPRSDLDGFYTIFAQVVAGMRNVEMLRQGDKILRIRFPKKELSDETTPASDFDMSDGY